jgi:hypothetical protein
MERVSHSRRNDRRVTLVEDAGILRDGERRFGSVCAKDAATAGEANRERPGLNDNQCWPGTQKPFDARVQRK